jgi:hypothetical protein
VETGCLALTTTNKMHYFNAVTIGDDGVLVAVARYDLFIQLNGYSFVL